MDGSNNTKDATQLLIVTPGIRESFEVIKEVTCILHGTKTVEDLCLCLKSWRYINRPGQN
jgi:hypothetical protein